VTPRTGDVAVKDGDGHIWYKGREDDLISSDGYRIGPTDIEECLMKHSAVLMAAVVGDPVCVERVRTFVVAEPRVKTGPGLSERSALLGASVWHTIRHRRRSSFFRKIIRRELRTWPSAMTDLGKEN
jgi:acyl-coenzyme A synthetase/AMP-(fatty) acid ligase